MTLNRYIDNRGRMAAEQIRTGRLGIEAEQEMRAKLFKDYQLMQENIRKSTLIRSKILELINQNAKDDEIIRHLLRAINLMVGDPAWYKQCTDTYARKRA